ncbi:DUF5000 domain-containing lipoprotein [Parabacteroides sp. Marseille-P3160]|uniref:DUF5000 domain-containing lipoprotein n=1 Tax=Parabacteroides sp. Marseille-P3160 TaxID=1917887 RepID=UPI0009BC04ED|nr:DUF5000 domain-containing lipoprotein [Parabacteroides sp. Marseille-P3160]
MKNIYINIMILFLLLCSCKEEYVGQYPVDDIAPQQISEPVVENMEGKVKISYKLPNETDLLYVKAVYKNTLGNIKEERASVFKNELYIYGFGKSKKQTIELITVDRSQNESAPLYIEIEPLDSPIYKIYESLNVYESWGGIKMIWENLLNEQIVVEVYKKEEDEFIDLETIYSKEKEGSGAVRGLDTIPQKFCIFIRDIYQNYTDTLITILKPLFEVKLPSNEFKELPLAPGYAASAWSNGWNKLWDGIATGDDSKYYLSAGDPKPYFTVDLGHIYKLSRTKVWGRTNYAYSLHNPRYFEFWGTTDFNSVKDPANWDGWVRLLECESHKPSGNESTVVTAEDKAYAEAGEEYEFPDDVIPVRYIRFRCIETWTKTNALHLNELSFWGKAIE